MQCKKNQDGSGVKCKSGATNCCAKRILELELRPDFQEQKLPVQEVPKFHQELNLMILLGFCA